MDIFVQMVILLEKEKGNDLNIFSEKTNMVLNSPKLLFTLKESVSIGH